MAQRPKPTASAGSSEQVKLNGLGDEAMLDRRRVFGAEVTALRAMKGDGGAIEQAGSDELRNMSLAIRKGTLGMLIEIRDDIAGDEEKLKALGKKAVVRW